MVMELLSRFDSGELLGLAAIVGGLLFVTIASVVKSVARNWRGIRETEINAALKQDMLNRGMSAEDIRTVLEAGSKGSRNPFTRNACRS
jgi:hypothetical protein